MSDPFIPLAPSVTTAVTASPSAALPIPPDASSIMVVLDAGATATGVLVQLGSADGTAPGVVVPRGMPVPLKVGSAQAYFLTAVGGATGNAYTTVGRHGE